MPSKAVGQRRRPTQERAKETRQHILDTAARLFGERGIENTSTNRIAAEAGLSIGTVYRYFSDRTVIVEELLERLLESIERRFTERLDRAERSVEDMTADILAAICDELVDNAKLVRALAAGVQFYNSGIPEFEPRLRLLVKVLLIQILGPSDDHELDVMAFVLVNTGFSAVLRASALEVDPEERREAIVMTARMIGAWSTAEIERRAANSA
ncbi:TetR/AcrR family transcriptional regulator [Nocardia cerradoensis]|uniref:HTH-type transcriptional regulator AcrR n=1 Tax=Nocardia cerradoensis TaxID=85688 RepID=A0A231HEH5_9NOCA|nr:TetR family transcriptional regulator [Nocardia cerradoensis]NKY45464.1 TetR family transcriptional regulator [Nocardia cerradoensis]OXR47351.1 HTH-type transcriptional regulator AcrR [Nocardia cerradoensis]